MILNKGINSACAVVVKDQGVHCLPFCKTVKRINIGTNKSKQTRHIQTQIRLLLKESSGLKEQSDKGLSASPTAFFGCILHKLFKFSDSLYCQILICQVLVICPNIMGTINIIE